MLGGSWGTKKGVLGCFRRGGGATRIQNVSRGSRVVCFCDMSSSLVGCVAVSSIYKRSERRLERPISRRACFFPLTCFFAGLLAGCDGVSV